MNILGARQFCDNKKPPKGFEKFFKKKEKSKNEDKKEEQERQQPDQEPPKKSSWNFSSFMNDQRGSNSDGSGGGGKYPQYLWLAPLLGFGAYSVYRSIPNDEIPEITFQEVVRDYLQGQKVKRVNILINRPQENMGAGLHDIIIIGFDDRPLAKLRVPDVNAFLQAFENEQQQAGIEREHVIPVAYQDSYNRTFSDFSDVASKVLSFTINAGIIVMMLAMLYRMSGGNKGGTGNSGGGGGFGDMFNMSKNKFKVYGTDQKVNVKFNQVAGLQEAKKEIMEFVEFLKNPQKFRKLGAKIPRGALLVGPPGTGKTLLAKATAGEADVPFFSMSGSEFVEMFVGVGASRVRELFKQAKEKAPSIIFIDEIDAVGRKRHSRMGGGDERDNTLNQLLVEMDGFGTDTNVIILAGTNRKDILDNALTRPGRFDRTIELTTPDLQGREDILKVHLKPLLLDPANDVTYYAKHLAALTPGFSGADLANICNEAAILAARADKPHVSEGDFETATERVIGGLEKQKTLDDRERRIVAHHEAGHAVAGWFLEGADPVLKVSILPRSKGALGFAQFLPNETSLYAEEELHDKICMALGGRIAEEIFFGDVTTGAGNDLQQVTNIATQMVTSFGMNDRIGHTGYQQGEDSILKPFSEDTNRMIDQEVRTIIDQNVEKTRALLTKYRDQVEALANALLEKERVTHADLVAILGERPFEGSESYTRYREHQDELALEAESSQGDEESKSEEKNDDDEEPAQ